ncbi:MAG: DUF86 domain-containing protein [Firmicutes bacterium]|nr:DUF86 domain-containing protein [Bacillota bacterium]
MYGRCDDINNLNIDLLQQKSTDIIYARKLLNKYAKIPIRAFLADETVISAANYQLIVAIEAAQNICNHLAARVAKKAPTSYSDCYLILRDEGIISDELGSSLAKMAKFRNLLVHKYGNIDNAIVYNIISSGQLDYFNLFLEAVKKLVEE